MQFAIKYWIAKFALRRKFEVNLWELGQFKADCNILFTGPLCDLKDKQRTGLLINWLGRQATQIIASSTDITTDSPEEVFEALERVFRP